MKVYIAGKLGTNYEKESLEKIEILCKSLGFETFLPHKDIGICKGINDVKRIFEGDIIRGFDKCDLIIALLDGLHVGAGTSWELGFAYAKNIPIIGIKTDEKVEDSIEYLSAILIGSMKIVNSFEGLKAELKKMID